MSSSVADPAEIRRAARRRESIPEGYDLDKDGRPTTDAQTALGGVVLPNVGRKDSGLAIMIDIFEGIFHRGCLRRGRG